jgi:hypothetical protein
MHKTVSLEGAPELRTWISIWFYLLGLEDVGMRHILREDGRVFWVHSKFCFLITSVYEHFQRSVPTLRLIIGLQYRVVGTIALQSATESFQEAMILEFKSKLPAQYEWQYIWHHISFRGILVARDLLFKIMKELDPEGVEGSRTRFNDGRDRTGKYILPGPNYAWLVDGYMKFQTNEIEIYAMVYGYSRYVTSIFVGLSATCGLRNLRQCLNAVVGNDSMRPHCNI